MPAKKREGHGKGQVKHDYEYLEARIHTPKHIPKHQAHQIIKDAVATIKKKREKRGTFYTTVKRNIEGMVVYVDIPSDVETWDEKKYGYQLNFRANVILIRIIPKVKYTKHLLSHEELERRLLLIKKKDIDINELIVLTDNPFDVLERRGKIIRLTRDAIKKGIHIVSSHYENPEECEDEDEYVLDHVIHGNIRD